MTATDMIRLMNRKPFEPLDIHLADGAKIRVDHPYQMATRQNSPVCFIYDADDEMRFVSYRNITQVVTKTHTEDSAEDRA